jgi:hypothetical protein
VLCSSYFAERGCYWTKAERDSSWHSVVNESRGRELGRFEGKSGMKEMVLNAGARKSEVACIVCTV